MLTSGDVIDLDFGLPSGSEAGFSRPAVVLTAQRILDASPTVIHVVPLTSTLRDFAHELPIDPDLGNGLNRRSAAQCQHIRSVAVTRVTRRRGHVGPVALSQMRDMLSIILGLRW